MAFLPFIYGVWLAGFNGWQLLWGLAWLALNLFSYPFLQLFSRKPTERNQQWAGRYFVIALIFGLPVIIAHPQILQFCVVLLPLAAVQIYFAKRKDERNLLNDLAGILTFGIVGMSATWLGNGENVWSVLLHPNLFFFACTLYIKSLARERKNPRYYYASVAFHLLGIAGYVFAGMNWIAAAYLLGALRAAVVPKLGWNIKRVGLLEFAVMAVFLILLCTQ